MKHFVYWLCWMLLSGLAGGCVSLTSLDAVYPVNPVAGQTPVYREGPRRIIIDLSLLADTLSLPVTVYHGHSYASIHRTQPVGVSDDYSFRWRGRRDRPHFFGLVGANGASVVVAERLVPLRGTDNTRDLGGYRTRDGRTVRWGRLYRSGDLSGLKRSEDDHVRRLGLREVIDFRGAEDRDRKPDRLPSLDSLATRSLAIYGSGLSRRENRKLLQRANPDEFNAETILLTYNQQYIRAHTSELAQTFAELLQQDAPLLYHCSAGKDRTGLMTALLLLALDVPMETVMRDFMASNYYRRRTIRFKTRFAPLIGIHRRVALPLLEVRPIYLEEALRTITEAYGSLEQYFREGLRLSESDRATLQEKYLE